MDPVPRVGLREAGLFVDRLDAHLPHEGPDVDPACRITPASEFVLHAPGAKVGHIEVDLVDRAHELPVLIGDGDRCIVDA